MVLCLKLVTKRVSEATGIESTGSNPENKHQAQEKEIRGKSGWKEQSLHAQKHAINAGQAA